MSKMVQYASRSMEDWLAGRIKVLETRVAKLQKELETRVAKLEAEEAREAKQGTIRPETRRGPKSK